MLTQEQIREKLFELPISFNVYFKNKEYGKAKHCYDMARMVSAFVNLQEEDSIRLFGNRAYKEDYEELTDGLFREEDVDKAVLICIRRGQTYDKEDYRPKK